MRLFTDVRPGEGRTTLMMLANVFLLLAAYYFLKPARDGLLAASGIEGLSKTELKAYASVGHGLVLLVLVPLYARMTSRLPRQALIARVNLFFIAILVAFWSLQPGLVFERVPYVGVAFYVWVGVFGLSVLASFWSFAADLFDEEGGKRLFPLIALGASAGAITGAWAVERLISSALVDTYALLLIAALLLAISTALSRTTETRLAASRFHAGRGAPAVRSAADATGDGPFTLVWKSRYLVATTVVILVLNWVGTNGENLLFGSVQALLDEEVRSRGLTDPAAIRRFLADGTTAFYGGFFLWTNAAAFLLQALVASRLIKLGGFGAALLMLPVIALVSYTAMFLFPVLSLLKVMKVAENATSYSINNTASQLLWLPTSAEVKYKAKAVVDTMVVRLGDGLAAATAFVGLNVLRLPAHHLYVFNLALVVVWLVAAIILVREHKRLSAPPAAVLHSPLRVARLREFAGMQAGDETLAA